jgi:hypothetical protein
MTTISSVGKVAYIYDEATTTWFPVAGTTNTSADFSWTGDHVFGTGASVTVNEVIAAKAGVNNFANPTARDAAIPSPVSGTVVFVRQDNSGNPINQLQYYSSGWKNYVDAQLLTKTANYVLELKDSGKVVNVNASSETTITVPTNATVEFSVGTIITFFQIGTGTISFVEASGVTIRSKNSYKKTNTQYCGAQLVKLATNEWLLAGDLKA